MPQWHSGAPLAERRTARSGRWEVSYWLQGHEGAWRAVPALRLYSLLILAYGLKIRS